MGFKCGIVGLPNVGKSTLFNALTKTAAAQAANYPFCTIEPNVGRVGVPDQRLDTLAVLAGSQTKIATQLEIVDIAGLVKGASKGEGLGNQFLANIREVDAIIHVLRCFDNDDVTHVEGSVDPVRDAEIIETELLLADIESLDRRLQPLIKKAKTDKEAALLVNLLERLHPHLDQGKPAHTFNLTTEEAKIFKHQGFLTAKPILYVCNVDEETAATGNGYTEKVQAFATQHHHPAVLISASIESEIANLSSEDDKQSFLESLGLLETGLDRVIREGYNILKLLTFFTVGPKEARAWTVRQGALAPEAAGVIHTDFERGYICAETIAFDDYVLCKGEKGAKEQGKLRLEGRDYPVKDGDVFHFRFNV